MQGDVETSAGAGRPLLLLDVDGPLNPYAASNSTLPVGYRKAGLASGYSQSRVRLNRAHGPMLWRFAEEQGLELAWATMWGPWAANQMIGFYLGLPELDGVAFDSLDMDFVREHGREWKFGYVEHWAAGRSLAWFDDEFQMEHEFRDRFLDRRERAGASTLLVDVSPSTGLTSEHFEQVADWVKAL